MIRAIGSAIASPVRRSVSHLLGDRVDDQGRAADDAGDARARPSAGRRAPASSWACTSSTRRGLGVAGQGRVELDDDEEAVAVVRDERRGRRVRGAVGQRRAGRSTRRDAVDRGQVACARGPCALPTAGSVGSMPCRASVSERRSRRPASRIARPCSLSEPGHRGGAGGQPVEQVLAVHADDRERVAEHDEHEPHGDGEAWAVGDDATDTGEHAGHRRR